MPLLAKQSQETGTRRSLLDKPRVLCSEPGSLAQSLFFGPLLLLGSLGALGCLFGTFQVPVHPLPAALVGGVCLVFFLFLFLSKHASWIFSLGAIVLWAAAVWSHFQNLLQGCAYTVNLVLAAYEDKLGITLPFLETENGLTQQEIGENCTWFFCLFLFPFLFCLSWLLVERKSALGSFCLTGLLLLVPLAISRIPPTPFLGALLLFWAVLLLVSPSFGTRHRLLEDRGRFHAGGSGAARPAMLLLFLGVGALSMALTYWLVPPSTYQRPQIATDLWEGLTSIRWEIPFQGGVGSGNNRVNLSSLGSRTYTGETMLRVKFQWKESESDSFQQKEFLKSFVGSVYTGTSWEKLPSQQTEELRQLLGQEHPQAMLDRLETVFDQKEGGSYHLSVENVNANPQCAYTPYGLVQNSVDETSLAYVDDGFLESARFWGGTSTYQVDAWGNAQQLFYPERVVNGVLTGSMNQEGKNSSQSTSAYDLSVLLEEGLYNQDGSVGSLENWELWTLPQEAAGYLTQEQQSLCRTLESYNRFVYDHYTQLPQELRETLLKFLEENGVYTQSYYDAFSTASQIQKVIATLASRCVYTLTPPSLPEGRDFVEYFLFESRQGYCVHFASAAAAMLRAMGIPARYAEGYAVPSGEEGWVDVPDYNAHAWVEVYFGGTGWVPVEVTPAGPDAPAATENARPMTEPAEPTPVPTPTPSPTASPAPSPSSDPETSPASQPSPTAQASSPAPGSGGDSPSRSGWLPVLAGVLGGAALLAGGVLLRRKLLLRSRRERFSQPDRNKAVLELYASLLELRNTAEKSLPTWQEELPAGLEDLALKARFSQHVLTREEAALFQKEWTRMAALLEKELPFFRKLWCRLGPVLF